MSNNTREALAALPPLPIAHGTVLQSGRYGREWYPGAVNTRFGGTAVYTAEQMQAYARAALATQPAQPSAQGEAVAWKLVPVVPTPEMERAAFDELELQGTPSETGTMMRNRVYRAMLASAPAAPAQAVPLTRQQINDMMRDAGWQNSAIRQADLDNVERIVRIVERGIAPKAAPSNS